ncbi:MAG: hypothetical protein II630_07075, partial [Bacteroidales bacterium]|nr:hypothetical protein [Bacteroidales bacterium]
MSKERFLTVMVPIKDSDCEPTVYASLSALESAVTPSSANTNKIYKVADGTYYRSLMDASSGVFSYNEVTEREFPYLGDPLTIYDFTYDATRMGTAPTISAQNVMRYADKNGADDVTLEGLWTQECHVVFNGERFYLKRIPTSSKTNEDARYKYDLDFVSETICLENVYFYDIEAPFATGKPVSENSTFSFFGGIEDLVNRINANFIMSGLAFLVRKHVNYENHPSIEVPYLTYSQWNQVNVYPASLIPSVFETSWYATLFLTEIYNPLNGDYNRYLMQYIYVNDNGDYEVNGYKCVIGKDKMGETASSEEKLVSFDDNTIHEALRQFHDTFECDYYIAREKDSNDIFTGNTLIVVGDCEHDFADWDNVANDYVRDANGLPMTDNPFDYGATNELLSKEKTNTTDKIVTRITGVGSSENIPWHYPNPTPDGWIKPMFLTKGVVKPSVTIDYPTDEGSTAEDYARYEKYLKNRIGKMFSWGSEKGFHTASEYAELHDNIVVIIGGETYKGFRVDYEIQKNKILNPRITFSMYYPSDSGCYGFSAYLLDAHGDTVDSYSSWVEYQNPTAFQTMCLNRNSFDMTELMQSPPYTFRLEFLFESIPSSETYDYEGYIYPSAFLPIGYHGRKAYIGQNFYQQQNLLPYVNYTIGESYIYIYDAGYSTNGLPSGRVEPIPRVDGKKYKDVANDKVHVCTTSSACNVTTGQFKDAFTERASMTWEEWISTFLSMRLRLFESNGWYLQNKSVALSDYGLGTPMHGASAYTPDIFDTIDFRMVKWLSPKS